MARLVASVLGIFSIGFLILGLLLAALPLDNVTHCGSLISNNGDCTGTAGRIALVVLLLGLSATCLAARLTALWATPQP